MQSNAELSEREREILRLVATGASNKEIAKQLNISANTVKVHLRNIFVKASVVSRTEATLFAIREGIVQVESAQVPTADTGVTSADDSVAPRPSIRSVSRGWLLIAPAMLLVFLGGLFLVMRNSAGTVAASPVPSVARPQWQEKATLPGARSKLAAAVYESQIYIFGGETGQGVTSAADRYNPTENSWTDLAPKPLAVAETSAAVLGGRIYVPGGRLASGGVSDKLEVYDPRQDRWEERAPLPVALSAAGIVALEGKLYLFGGWDGQQALGSVYEYDPNLDAWRSRSSMPTPRASPATVVSGNRVYVMGGYDETGPLALNDEYRPEVDNGSDRPWNARAQLPEERRSMGATAIAGMIYLIGGIGKDEQALPALQYVPHQDKWQRLELAVPPAWSHMALVSTETHLYALGGAVRGTPTAQNLAYQAIYTILIPVVR